MSNQSVSISKAKKAIADYKKAIGEPAGLAGLSIFYCEEAFSLLESCAFEAERYFVALIRMYGQAVRLVLDLPVAKRHSYAKRLGNLRSRARPVGWRIDDELNNIWYEAGLDDIKAHDLRLRTGYCMNKMRRYRPCGPLPSVAEPRRPLLLGAYSFVRAARLCPGVRCIALLGSLATAKAIPKDVDLLVTVEWATDLSQLARAGRRLKGLAQTINLGADIFLADTAGHYLGRICHYRECHPRIACRAQHCGLRTYLNDDLHVVTLSKDLLASPPIELWPKVIRRLAVPEDLEEILLIKLERQQ